MSEAPYSRSALISTLKQLSEEPYHDYWYHLGKFVHHFAQAENRLLYVVRELTNMADPIAGIVFSGTRLDAAKDLINKILDATGQADRKLRLGRTMDQLSAIGTIRNNVLHWGARHDGQGLLVSNASLKPTPSKLKEFHITIEDFTKMIDDLERIGLLIMTENNDKFTFEGPWKEFALAPWRYKPPQPSPPKTPRPQAVQSPKRQRRASEASQKNREK